MTIIPPEKMKPTGDTSQMFPADPDKFKTFTVMFELTSKAPSIHSLRKDTNVTHENVCTADIMSGRTPSRFVASIISAISADWTGEEPGRYWKSC